jgi:hypothetical protein
MLDCPEEIEKCWHQHVATASFFDPEKEHMVVFVLDARLRFKGWNMVSIGSVRTFRRYFVVNTK